MDVETELEALLIVSVVSVAAPFVSAFLARLLVPQVVVLIAGDVLIGPQVGGLAKPESVELVSNVGLGFLFLLAGYELELDLEQRIGEPLDDRACSGGTLLRCGVVEGPVQRRRAFEQRDSSQSIVFEGVS